MKQFTLTLTFCIGLIFTVFNSHAQCTIEAFASPSEIRCGESTLVFAIASTASMVTVFDNDFNGSTLGAGWSTNANVRFDNPCGNDNDGTPHAWVGAGTNFPRELTTIGYNIPAGGQISFDLKLASCFNPIAGPGCGDCEAPDESDEGVYIQFNNGSGWQTIDYYDPSPAPRDKYTQWATYSYPLPTGVNGAIGPNIQFRWYQDQTSGATVDHWGIDNALIKLNDPNYVFSWNHKPGVDSPNPGYDVPVDDYAYTVTYSDGVNSCQSSVSVTVTKPVITAMADKIDICPGDLVQLDTDNDWIEDAPTCGGNSNMGCSGTPLVVTANIGGPVTRVDQNFGGPWGTQSVTGTIQYIYTAAELTAVGLKPGKITSLALNCTFIEDFSSSNVNYCNNFAIKMRCSTKATYAGNDRQGGLTTVYSVPKQTFKLGWNTFGFDNAYNWDGTSNLIIDICYYNGSSLFSEFIIQANETSVNRIISDETNGSSQNYCGKNSQWDNKYRPITRFELCEPYNPKFNWVWSPNDGTFNPDVNAKNPTVNPITTTTYTVSGYVEGTPVGCTVEDQITINVQNAPETPVPTYNVGLCERDNLVINFGSTAIPVGPSYEWRKEPAGAVISTSKNLTINNATPANNGTYSVLVKSSAGCPSLKGTINVTINPAPTGTITSNTPKCDGFDAVFALTPNTGGNPMTFAWSGPGAAYTSTLEDPTFNEPFPAMNGNHSVVITNTTTGCTSIAINHNFVQTDRPAAPNLTANKLSFCPGEDLILTNDQYADDLPIRPRYNFYFGGPNGWTAQILDDFGAQSVTKTLGLGDGGDYYLVTQIEDASDCISDTAWITISVFDPGSFTATNNGPICDGDDLQLNVTVAPGAVYSWTGPNAYGPLGGDNPTRIGVDATTDAGVYTVNVNNGVCTPFDVTTTVVIDSPRDPGTDATVGICETVTDFDLFGALGGTPEALGSWTDDDVSGGLNIDEFDATGLGNSSYDFTYTLTTTNSCPDQSAVVTVDVTHQPIAGVDNTAQICNNETALNLFTLLGVTAETNGAWSESHGEGTLSTTNWDGTWDATGVAAGNYDFIYTVTAATTDCPDAVATITVTVIEELDAGTSTTLDMCENDNTAYDLHLALGSPDVGTWTNVDAAVGFNSGAGTFQANAGDTPETYRFDYTVSAPSCPSKTATVTVISHRSPVAGEDGSASTCNSENAFDLFLGLGGTPDLINGTWNNDSGAGSHAGSTWDATGVTPGNYDFTYTVTDPTGNCADVAAIATISVVDQPVSGTATQINKCSDYSSFSLFDGLTGHDLAGKWYSGVTEINDMITAGSYTGGTYNFTYTVAGVSPCVDASTIVTVEVEDKPYAGEDASVSTCETITSLGLFAILGGSNIDTNGSWDDGGVPGSINGLSGDLNPSVLNPGVYYYTYTVPATTYCPADNAVITVTVIRTPIAGDDVSIAACNADNSDIVLLTELTANSVTTPDGNGSWYNITDGAPVPTGKFNPFGKTAGDYVFEYTVDGTSPCFDDVAQLTITIENQPVAGNDGIATICNLKTNYNLFFALQGTSDNSSGTWLDLSNTGALSGPQNKIFNASTPSDGVYLFGYKLAATAPCLNDTAFIEVTVTGQPDAGLDATFEICNDRVIDLFSELGGTPHSGGVWTDNGAGTGSVVDPAIFDANGIAGGTYVFRYDLTADDPCNPDFSIVTIHVNAQPDAGTNGTNIVCNGDGPFSLFGQLGGNPTSGGEWTDVGNNTVSDAFNPVNGATGIYTYTPFIPNQCQVVTSEVDVTVNKAPQVTAIETCETDALNYTVTLTITGGDPGSYFITGDYVKGVAAPVLVNGTLVGNTFTSDLIPTRSTYTFSVDDANNCGPTMVSKYLDCGCATRVGELQNPLPLTEVCVGSIMNIPYDPAKEVSDGDDGVNFILHDDNSSSTAFGNIIDVNKTDAIFNFLPGTMTADQTYYVSAVYGTIDGNGIVNLADTCLSIDRIPVRFNSNPEVSMGPDQELCFGDSRNLEFTFTNGTGDYTITFDDASTSTGLNNTNNTVSKSPGVTTIYKAVLVSDANGCSSSVKDSTILTVIPLPDLTMTGDITYCEGTSQPVLTFAETNVGVGVSPYTVTVTDPINGDVSFNTSNSSSISFPATGPGTFVYTFKNVVDGSSQACSASPNTMVTVVVNPTPVVTLSGDKTICDGDSETIDINFTTGTAPYTVVYNDGVNPDVVDAGIMDNPKTYTFNPTVNTSYAFKSVTDDNGCVLNLNTNNVVNFTVNQLPVLNDVSVDDIELCNGTNTQLLFDIDGNGDFTVDYTINGDPFQETVDGNSAFTIFPTAVAGSNVASTYDYAITKITDNASPYQCVSNDSKSAQVTVYPLPTGIINVDQSPICENTPVQLDFEFTGVDQFDYRFEQVGGNGGVQFINGVGYNDSQSFVPQSSITDFAYNLLQVTSTAPSGFQCSDTMLNQSVDLLVQLAPLVDITGNALMCQKDSREVTFNVSRTTWPVTIELGNDVNANIITYNLINNGDKKALNPMQPTNYNVVTVTDNSPLACVGTAVGVFNLDVITLPTATMTAPTQICEGTSDFLTFELKDGRGGYTVQYAEAGVIDTLSYPGTANVTEQISITPIVSTAYKLLKVTDQSGLGCHTDYDQKIIVDVVPIPVVKMDGNNLICAGDSTEILFYFTKGTYPFTLTYSDGFNDYTETNIRDSRSVWMTPTDTTEYVLVSITDGSDAGCAPADLSNIDPVKIAVKKLPDTNFKISKFEDCAPFTPIFTNLTDEDKVGEITWDFGDQTKATTNYEAGVNTFEHVYERSGVYEVTLTITTPGDKKCKASKTHEKLITVNTVPIADFDFFPAQATIMDPQVRFYNQTKSAEFYQWIVDGDTLGDGENFEHIFKDDDERTYDVTLIAKSNTNPVCIDTTTRKVLIRGELFVNVPNSFTPNQDDINDVFIPIIDGYENTDYLFEIYDRWGEIVFSTNDPTKGWEGNHNGQKAPSDLYVWKLELKSKYLVEKSKYMGQVRLMR